MDEWADISNKKTSFLYKNKIKVKGSLFEKNIIKINENSDELNNNLLLLKKDCPHIFTLNNI